MEAVPKYILIYRKASGKHPAFGDLSDVRVGDAVTFKDENEANASGYVAKVNVRAGVLRTETQMYQEYVLRMGQKLTFDRIEKLERLNPLYKGDKTKGI